MAAVTVEGFETYRAFAPEGWTPPSTSDETAHLLRMLAEDWVWYRVAEHDGELVGHVGFLPADHTFAPAGDPGSRTSASCSSRARTGAAASPPGCTPRRSPRPRARGFTAMRLFTPAAQARARRFYEREGWALARDRFFEDRIGLEIAEYRRAL